MQSGLPWVELDFGEKKEVVRDSEALGPDPAVAFGGVGTVSDTLARTPGGLQVEAEVNLFQGRAGDLVFIMEESLKVWRSVFTALLLEGVSIDKKGGW